MRERTVKTGKPSMGRTGKVLFYSPPSGVDWDQRFGVQVTMDRTGDMPPRTVDILVTRTQARHLAAELTRRADDLEDRL